MTGPASMVGAGDRPAAPDCVLQARDVAVSFGQTPALRGASVSVGAGEILAVMGPSGSGKSTLLHCLAGILVPDLGEVWFDGRRVDTASETERSTLRRDRFGFVFQFGQLVPELTAEENIALPLLLGGTRRGRALAEARPWFGRLDLDGLERRRSGELSGGRREPGSSTPRQRSASCCARRRSPSSATGSPDTRSARSGRRRSPPRIR